MDSSYAIIKAPSVLGLRPTGVQYLPDALMDAGLGARLHARDAGSVDPPEYDERRDPETQLLNPSAIATYTPQLADLINQVFRNGEFPLVLGGDCSIVLGSMLALRRLGRHGLLFVDGHADFYQPAANVNGEAASSDLALVTGRGPDVVTTFDGYCPLVQDEDVVAFGVRDADEAAAYGSHPLPATMTAIPLAHIRTIGVAAAAATAIEHLVRAPSRGFWIHLDVDALDDAIMPAVDYRLPGGLSWDELRAVLRSAISSKRAVGMDVTIFNPRLDPDGALARSLVDALASALGR